MTHLAKQSDTYAYREVPNGSSTAQSTQSATDEPASLPASKPLRVVHVGPCFSRGGAENHAIDLARFLDPSRVRIEKCIVTDPNMFDSAVAADMPAPVELGDEQTVRRAAQEHDVVLFWGMMLDSWLADCRPPLCVYLAYGDSYWTHDLLVVDYVGRFENLPADWEPVRQRFDLAPLPWTPVDSTRRRSDFDFHRPHYTPELVDIVARRYADDLRHFGYEFKSSPQPGPLADPTPPS